MAYGMFSPEEVILTVNLVAFREAFVAEMCLAVGTFQTLAVP